MFSAIISYQFVDNSHPHLLLLAELNLEDKTGVETNVVEKDVVPKCDVVDSVVFPNCF